MRSDRQKCKYDNQNNFEFTVENLSRAIFVVNKHAKSATDSTFLYELKKKTLEKMLKEGKAQKIGLHFSRNPKFSIQSSTVLISCGVYLFHLPPSKEDFQNLPHLGNLNDKYRNPKTSISLKQAKALLMAYSNLKKPQKANPYLSYLKRPYIPAYDKRYGER